MSSWHGAL